MLWLDSSVWALSCYGDCQKFNGLDVGHLQLFTVSSLCLIYCSLWCNFEFMEFLYHKSVDLTDGTTETWSIADACDLHVRTSTTQHLLHKQKQNTRKKNFLYIRSLYFTFFYSVSWQRQNKESTSWQDRTTYLHRQRKILFTTGLAAWLGNTLG